MSKVSIDYSVNDLVFRSRQFHISWISQNNSIEWQTNDAPTIHAMGGLIEWVIFESILASLNKLLSSNQNHYEGFRYFRDLFVDLTPDTEISRSNELRTQIECRLPDELSDLEFNVVNSDYPLTDLLGFYLYFSSYLPNLDFPISGDHFIIVELSKQSELVEQIAIPTAIEPRWLNWKPLTSLDSHVFIEVIKELPITLILKPFGTNTLATKIYEYTTEGEWELASQLSIILLVILIPMTLVFNSLVSKRQNHE